MPLDRTRAALSDILTAAVLILDFLADMDEDSFRHDARTRSAVERQFITIGEAVRRLPPEFLSAHPEVPWSDVVGQRNLIAHRYDTVDSDRIFATAANRLAGLMAMVERLMAELPPATE